MKTLLYKLDDRVNIVESDSRRSGRRSADDDAEAGLHAAQKVNG